MITRLHKIAQCHSTFTEKVWKSDKGWQGILGSQTPSPSCVSSPLEWKPSPWDHRGLQPVNQDMEVSSAQHKTAAKKFLWGLTWISMWPSNGQYVVSLYMRCVKVGSMNKMRRGTNMIESYSLVCILWIRVPPENHSWPYSFQLQTARSSCYSCPWNLDYNLNWVLNILNRLSASCAVLADAA